MSKNYIKSFDQLGSVYLLKVKLSLLIEICWHFIKIRCSYCNTKGKTKSNIMCVLVVVGRGKGDVRPYMNRLMYKEMKIPSTVIHSIHHFTFGIIFQLQLFVFFFLNAWFYCNIHCTLLNLDIWYLTFFCTWLNFDIKWSG